MLGETKKSYKIIGWCIVALTIVLAINYFVYSRAFAERGGADNMWWDSVNDTAEWQFCPFDAVPPTIEKGQLTSNKDKVRYDYNEWPDYYWIENLYLSFCPDTESKIRVNYDSGISGPDCICKFSFDIQFIAIDDNGNEVQLGYSEPGPFGLLYRTEWRTDRKSGKGDYFTFDTNDSSDFSKHTVLKDLRNNLNKRGVTTVVIDGQTKEINNCSLKDLVNSGHCKILLLGGRLDT